MSAQLSFRARLLEREPPLATPHQKVGGLASCGPPTPVRVPHVRADAIRQALERGAEGVAVPRVGSAAIARHAKEPLAA